MDKWIKVLELEIELLKELAKLIGDEHSVNMMSTSHCEENYLGYASAHKDYYTKLYIVALKRKSVEDALRELKQRVTDLGGIIHCASETPELAWAALNYFMLSSTANLEDLFVGDFKDEFEKLREGNILPKFESPLHVTILETLKRINNCQD